MNQKAKTIIALAGMAAVSIHVINKIQYSRCTSKNVLACTSNHFYEWRFGKIRYTRRGTGSPIVLLHDLTVGSSIYEFHKIEAALAKQHEVYCLDLLGYGLSDKVNMTYTNYLYVQLVTDFIKAIIGKKTDILAVGDAAPVAVMTCHNDPEILNKLILINPPSLYQLNQIPSKRTKLLKLMLDTPILGTFAYNLLTTRNLIEKTFKEEYFYDKACIDEKDFLSYLEAAHTPNYNSKYTLTSYLGRYMNANILHALKEINHSIYILAGESKTDSHTIIDNYLYYNNAIEAVFLDKTKHLPHLEKPAEVLQHLETFLA